MRVIFKKLPFLLVFLLLAPSCSNQQIETENRDSTIQNVHNSKLIKVQSIKQHESIKEELNHNPSVKIIEHNTKDKSHYISNQVVVDFTNSPSDQELNKITKDIKGTVFKKLDSKFIFQSQTTSESTMINYFMNRKDVEFAEPNYLLLPNEPNDVLYPRYQWNLPMIQTEPGWKISRGDKDVVIAVIDTGVDLQHPDLIDRLANGINILTDSPFAEDDNGHGTHVAGIIASQTNNSEGIAGITWFNPIMPIKVMSNEGYGSTFDIAKGIIWATDHGADIINLSLGNYQNSALLREAVIYAYNKDVVMIAASGNDNSSQPSFPASYPEVLSVAAVDYNGKRATFSNYGNYIDVTAPGVEIPSTYLHQQYAALSGTSMATPHVAALAALVRSANPALSNVEVMDIIKKTAIDLGKPGFDRLYGEGLIDVVHALETASSY